MVASILHGHGHTGIDTTHGHVKILKNIHDTCLMRVRHDMAIWS